MSCPSRAGCEPTVGATRSGRGPSKVCSTDSQFSTPILIVPRGLGAAGPRPSLQSTVSVENAHESARIRTIMSDRGPLVLAYRAMSDPGSDRRAIVLTFAGSNLGESDDR